jgi:protocatechuate 3,4-dioxygenase beta subunit
MRSIHSSLFRMFWNPLITGLILCLSIASLFSPVQAAGTITGNVFRDFNANGVDEGVNEIGVAGVTVTAYDAAGVAQGSATTNTVGDYTLNATGTGPYRIEFSTLPSGYFSGPEGSGSGGIVQFVADGNSSNVSLGVNHPADYCQANPELCTNVYVNGGLNTTTPVETLFQFSYTNTSATAPAATSLATKSDIGSTWGLAYNRQSPTIYSAAFLKRHTALGPSGLGAIYQIDPTTATPPSLFVDLVALGIDVGQASVPDNATRGLPPTNQPLGTSIDATVFPLIGTVGLGDIDISDDGTTLFVMNLFDQTVYSVDTTSGALGTSYAVPDPGCVGGNWRPFATKYHHGTLYVGGVCDAEVSQDVADLLAVVYRLDGGTFTNILSFPLNYTKGVPFYNCPSILGWYAWRSTIPPACNVNNDTPYPTPILADIEVDVDGSLILSFLDRMGHQLGWRNASLTNQSANIYSIVGGDILRANNNNGSFELENNATAGPNSTAGANNNQGPGGGEFYYQDHSDLSNGQVAHNETSNGGLAFRPGSGEVVASSMDPFSTGFRSGGMNWFNNTTGAARNPGYRLYINGTNSNREHFGKAAGTGDVEILCDLAPIEIGNRVWLDSNNNGRQDPGEAPIAGVTVTLHDAGGAQIASAVTDANGNYRFSSATGTSTASFIYGLSTLTPNTAFSVRVDTGQVALAGLTTTTPNFNGVAGDSHDSDGDTTINAGFATAALTTGIAGSNNHSYDFGFFPSFSLGNRVWFDTDNDGIRDASEVGADGVSVSLFLDANADGVPDNLASPVASTITADGGYYRFDYLPANSYVVRINPSNFTGTGALVGYTSSTPASAAPNGNADNDDNGINNAAPITNGILSGAITLGPNADEPTGETDLSPSGQGAVDAQANMTVDFGFFRLSVGNQLWIDSNNNGTLDGGESGTALAGVRVELYDGATLVAVTTTDANGAYLFDRQTDGTGVPNGLGLAPSANYTVRIPASEFALGEPLAPFRSSTGATSGTDSEDNGIDVPNLAATGISSAAFSLQPGSATVGASVTNASATTHNPTLDFGFYTLSLGNRVWLDSNNNGLLDGGESGISGVTVNLYRDSDNNGTPDGAAIATMSTNATGHYLFTGLTADTYIVEIVPPAGHISSTGSNGSVTGPYEPAPDPDTVATDSDDNGSTVAGTIRSAPVTLSAGGEPTGEAASTGLVDPAPDASSNLTVDFGLFRPLRLGNLVWRDLNNNGEVDGGETGISGVTVELLSGASVIATTITDASGNYLFDTLAPGDYVVRIPASNFTTGNPLANLASSTGINGSATGPYEAAPDPDTVGVDNDDNGSLVSGAVQSLPITLSLNGEPDTAVDGDDTYGNLTVDFGFFAPASLGNLVWYDTDVDGVQDGGETGVPNVTVTLYNAADNSVVATMSTDASGEYLFEQLIPGSYYVIFSDLPAGYGFVLHDQGGNDALDSDANQITGRTGAYTLVAGQHEPTVDAGIAPSTHLRLGNLVWADYNDNGQVDSGEPGISGVTVELLDGTGATVLATTTSDANGNYLFSNLNPGEYIVRIPASQFATGAVLESWSSSVGGGAYEPAADPDSNTSDNRDNGSTQGTGDVQSLPIELTLGNEPDTAVDGDDRDGNLTVDFGFLPQLASLGDTVWYDSTRNNIQDSGEAGVPNVTVRLLDSTNTVIATTTTLANGTYLFDNLVPGVYAVEFDLSTLPANYRFVSQDVGGNDTLDSDANPTTGRTIQTTLTAGENDLTWDAGIYQLASIGDRVWYDADGDGVQDSGEPNMPGVTVNLLDGSGTVIDTTTTDANGNYLFDLLEPGNYAIEVVPPAGYAFTTQDSGGNDATDSDVDPINGTTIVTTLDSGEDDRSWDAGLVGIMSLGDLVWNDLNNNGVVDGGETGISGVTVRLLNGSGTVLATTTTDANGNYLFSNLIPGDYLVEIVPPAGYLSSSGTNGSATGPYEAAPAPDNDINNDDNGTLTGAVIRSGLVSLVANSEPTNDGDTDANSNLTVDFGLYQPASLGDRVWHDQNENGIQDAGEPGVPNVTVTLYDGSGTLIGTTTTDANGNYRFDNLTPGSYSVGFSNLPSTLDRFTQRDQGADDAQDSDADTVSGRTQPITLAAGEHNPSIDAGIHGTAPSMILLSSFEAKWQAGKLVVSWSTSSERETWGFYVLRSHDDSQANAEQVNPTIVLGKGRAGQSASYQLVDDGAQAGIVYRYWLKEVELDGSQHFYGPFLLQSEQTAANYTVLLPFVQR